MRNKMALLIAGGILLLFIVFDIYHCPIKYGFGIPCPGCGMTHALKELMHFDISASIYYHAMLIPTGFFLIAGLLIKDPSKKYKLITAWSICMIVYYVARMMLVYPNPPMEYNSNNLVHIVLSSFHS